MNTNDVDMMKVLSDDFSAILATKFHWSLETISRASFSLFKRLQCSAFQWYFTERRYRYTNKHRDTQTSALYSEHELDVIKLDQSQTSLV